MKRVIILLALLKIYCVAFSQSPKLSLGIGIYPTGTETGFGLRTSKDKRLFADVRITRANVFSHPHSGSFVNEASVLYRIAYYEKVRFHVGIGGRADWNFAENQAHRLGVVTPIGVEAFPFPFQNAGLIFEAAPFFTTAGGTNTNFGIRTVAGFAFYFVRGKGL